MKFYIRHQGIVILKDKIWHTEDNIEIEINENQKDLLNFLEHKQSLENIKNKFSGIYTEKDIKEFIINNWIVEVSEENYHEFNQRGLFGASIEKFPYAINQKPNFIVLGMPFDLNVSNRPGTRFAPDIIRQNSKSIFNINNVTQQGLWDPNVVNPQLINMKILDIGNIKANVFEQNGSHQNQLSYLTQKILESDIKPIVLGGDHSISYSTINAVSQKHEKFGVIHIDAHSDFSGHAESTTTNGLHHGNFWDYLIENNNIKRVIQIGLRQLEYENIKHPKIAMYSSMDILKGNYPGDLDCNIPYYITFDIDVMDPSFISSVGTPVTGGLYYNDLVKLLDVLLKDLNVIGFDFVEYSPNNLMHEHIACSQIIYEIIRRIYND